MTSDLLMLELNDDPSEPGHDASDLSWELARDLPALESAGVTVPEGTLADRIQQHSPMAIELERPVETENESLRAAQILSHAALAIGGEQRLANRVERLLDAAIDLIGVRDSGVALLDEAGEAFAVVAARGRATTVGDRCPVDVGLIGSVVRAGKPLRIEDVANDPLVGDADVAIGPTTRSWLAVPLASSAGAFGALIVASHRHGAFGRADELHLWDLADIAAGPLHDARKLELARRVTNELETMQRRYLDVVEATADVCWEQDEEMRFTWISQSAHGLADGWFQGFRGKTWREMKPFGVYDDAWDRHEATLRAHRPFRDFQIRRLASDGSVQVVSINGRPFFDERGSFRGYRGSAVNVVGHRQSEARSVDVERAIVERARLEAVLQARARQQAALNDLTQLAVAGGSLASLLEAATVAVAGALDAELAHIFRARDQATLLLEAGHGWPDGLVGVAALDADAGSPVRLALATGEPLVTDHLASGQRTCGIALLRQQNLVSGAFVGIRTAVHPYGVLGAHSTRRMTFSQEDLHFLRAVANILAMAVDLARTGRTAKALVESTPDLVVRIGPDLTLHDPNTTFVLATGVPVEGSGGRTLGEPARVLSSLRDRWEEVARAVFRTGRERLAELSLATVRGERHHEIRFIPELGAHGQVRSVLVVARDVTALRRAEGECVALRQELLERDRQYQDLVGRLLVQHDGAREQAQRQSDAALIAEQLTVREVEILSLVIEGLTNRQIAARLHLSAGTVRNHLGRLFPKLDVADRTQAAVRAVELQLVGLTAT
jgi:DNA-binding NarL/FixJ family response regulator